MPRRAGRPGGGLRPQNDDAGPKAGASTQSAVAGGQNSTSSSSISSGSLSASAIHSIIGASAMT